jgi:hypothetical protein
MAVFAVYIQKSTPYQGATRMFGNTYHYTTDTLDPFDDALAAQQIHDAEKAVCSPLVRFEGWRTWGPTDGVAFDSVIRDEGTFADNGTGSSEAAMYREACALVVWPLSRSALTNRKRWLRKFLRLAAGTTVEPEPVYAGAEPMSGALQGQLVTNYADVVTDLSFIGNYRLSTEDGDVPVSPPEVRPYYFTRQIGQ